MTQRFTYEIILNVEREGILTVPVAEFRVLGRLDPDHDFGSQLTERFGEHLARRTRELERARAKVTQEAS